MTQSVEIWQPPQGRLRSREEMEELYQQIVVRDPKEGPRIVEVHKALIGMLDRMIEEQARRKSRCT
jgi:hypothetical protein